MLLVKLDIKAIIYYKPDLCAQYFLYSVTDHMIMYIQASFSRVITCTVLLECDYFLTYHIEEVRDIQYTLYCACF
jgi:hypothetical protein